MFSSGAIPSGLDLKMNGVDVGLALPPTLDGDQAGFFQFRDQLRHPHPAHAHVFGQSVLTRKAGIIVPGVAQKQGIRDLGADGKIRLLQNEVRNLGKATPQNGIVRVELDGSFLEHFSDGPHTPALSHEFAIGSLGITRLGKFTGGR